MRKLFRSGEPDAYVEIGIVEYEPLVTIRGFNGVWSRENARKLLNALTEAVEECEAYNAVSGVWRTR